MRKVSFINDIIIDVTEGDIVECFVKDFKVAYPILDKKSYIKKISKHFKTSLWLFAKTLFFISIPIGFIISFFMMFFNLFNGNFEDVLISITFVLFYAIFTIPSLEGLDDCYYDIKGIHLTFDNFRSQYERFNALCEYISLNLTYKSLNELLDKSTLLNNSKQLRLIDAAMKNNIKVYKHENKFIAKDETTNETYFLGYEEKGEIKRGKKYNLIVTTKDIYFEPAEQIIKEELLIENSFVG